MQKIALPTQWTVRAVSNFDEVPPEVGQTPIEAQVPGCVHLDLLRNNLIPDPYLAANENKVQWIGRTDWEYQATFTLSEEALSEERVDLVCEGLDTIATVWINGVEIGKSENMHVEARFPVKDALKSGDNEIHIRFDSAVYYARAMRDKLGDLPHASSFKDKDGVCEPFHFIRKNACNFGWDWGPGLITAGIWKTIRLEAWSVARIKSVRPLVKVANEKIAVVDVWFEAELTCSDASDFYVSAGFAESSYAEVWVSRANECVLSLYVQHPRLWWPTGYGEQPSYNLQVRVSSCGEGEDFILFDECESQIGLREVELDTTPDDVGAPWTIKVNGQPIWCKGANWIPDDVFLSRACEPERVRTRLQQAADAGMNMIRIWGGGIYETDDFYSICDEMGLLVWQDFLFACAAYAEESPMRELVEAEVRHNVTRLARHPSLVLWNGCNENIWGYFDWNWKGKLGGRTWGAGYYFEMLPRIVQELSPATPYWPGSPYSGSMDIHPLADQYGNKHMWETWNNVDYTYFRGYAPRFASEFGHQAPPTFSTLARAIPEADRDPYSPVMLVHQKAHDGNKKLHDRLAEHFEIPTDLDDWLFLMQLNQARAMTTACEWFRTRNHCSGALFWQLNDCWPVTSWAAIDGDGKPKPLYYAAKHFFCEQLLTIQPDGEHLALWGHNDTSESWKGSGTIRLLTMDGQETKSDTFDFWLDPRGVFKICDLEGLVPSNKQNEYLVAATDGADCAWFFDIDKNLNYPIPRFEAVLEGDELRITAQTLIRDIYINADRIGGEAEFGLVTLFPGDTWGCEIKGVAIENLNLETLTSRPILTCANYFGAKPR